MSNYSLEISVPRMDTVFNPNFFIGFKIPSIFKVNESTLVELKLGELTVKGIFEEKFDENLERYYFYRFVLGYEEYLEWMGRSEEVRFARVRNVMFYIDIKNVRDISNNIILVAITILFFDIGEEPQAILWKSTI